jgi:hypothetical protein
MRLAEALDSLSPSEKAQAQANSALLPEKATFDLECRLCEDAWRKIAQVLLSWSGSEPEDDRKRVVSQCLETWILGGPDLPFQPTDHERAIKRSTLVAKLKKTGLGEDEANGVLEHLFSLPEASALSYAQAALHTVDFGLLPCWSTFRSSSGAPVLTVLSAAEAHARLALSAAFDGQPIVVIHFARPTGESARFPTVADAFVLYKGHPSWHVLFRPAAAGASAGATLPQSPFESSAPLPEAVHKPPTIINLRSAPKLLR